MATKPPKLEETEDEYEGNQTCHYCSGSGSSPQSNYRPDDFSSYDLKCDVCDGSGSVTSS